MDSKTQTNQASGLSDSQLIYQLEGKPGITTALPLGLQHVLAMFTGNLAPILIVSGVCNLSQQDTVLMLQCAMIVSGLTTFLQLYPVKIAGTQLRMGAGLPIVMGTSFAFVPTAIAAGKVGGISAVLGGALVGAFVVFIIGEFYIVG